ncbi:MULTISPECIES: tannase/feruloyl esterase family alpha/beta hydrolase [unclassified Beijerinckia]|uniref:tannase/feruloyl esterase family alpha/beta hydrolase n=1 Tax=unclassified Beijerinckia TaxID=2638183 RepID=UPI00089A39C9|nr:MULTISPECIES: tannase/feruloyl esterase family alpha/beta hydrolase [unclassified Beijerinckia]MDH7798691.1 hypothetical protein [Beijerinckia sp. GAS462]SED29566.1 feruloyl esterase [Beijerinckia sp. 28-YEA-48]
MRIKALIFLLLLGAGVAQMAPAWAQSASTVSVARIDAQTRGAIECASLLQADFKTISEASTSITSATVVAASGGNKEYCKVEGTIAPQIGFELRLPTQSWNGRYFQAGCFGMCGAIQTDRFCADAQAQDLVVSSNDMGHKGTMWQADPWGGVAEQRENFGKRSAHVVAVVSKAVINAYYGQRAARSYFRGCSTGGREGLSEAQFYPGDFDGIIAGDFAMPTRQGIAAAWDAQYLLDTSDNDVFTLAKVELLHRAVMKACDKLDGLEDGILTDPRQCRFDPKTLLCAAGIDRDDCLTKAQIDAAVALYDGPRNSKGQRLTPGGRAFGSELGWGAGVYSGSKNRLEIANSALRNLAFAEVRPTFSYRDFTWDKDVAAMESQVALFDVMPPRTAPDLANFQKAGGKLIVYHGWADAGVPAVGTLDYYAQVHTRQGGLEATRDWFRVFLVPGMFHCSGGDAPNEFDLLSAMVAWVEKGIAPDGILATQLNADKSVKRTRPLYAYPAVAEYSGKGDVNDAANWHRALPKTVTDDRVDWIWAPSR